MAFSSQRPILPVLLVLMAGACSGPATYAPVKEVNQAIAPDNGYVPHGLPRLATDNQAEQQLSASINKQKPKSKKEQAPITNHEFLANQPEMPSQGLAPGQPEPDMPAKGTKQSADNNLSSKKADKPRITLQNKAELTSSHTVAMKKPTDFSVINPQKAVISSSNGNEKNKNNALKSNTNSNFAKNYSRDDRKKLDNLELTEKNSKKSIISIDNKKLLKLNFQWPLQGRLTRSFSQTDNKGIEIAGKTGQAVVASEAGKAVYCGHGLAGFGNLAIIKHNDTYLSAYANNSKLIVKEGQFVKKGQAIGQLGQTGLRKTALHFEIRKNGKPVNPLGLLPKN
jgi:murein DD-endopeptidase MepM/ murein hydrolase activator NlpD